MKRCPECRRDYYDDTLLYCLDDGNALLEGPGSIEPATAILPNDRIQSEAPTRRHMEPNREKSASETAENPSTVTSVFRKRWLLSLAGIVILAIAAFFGYWLFLRHEAKSIQSIAILPFENNSGDSSIDYLSEPAYAFLIAHRWDDAINESNRLLALDRENEGALSILAWVDDARGLHPDALAKYRKMIEVVGESKSRKVQLAYMLARNGDRESAKRIFGEITAGKDRITKYERAEVYAAIGEHDLALDNLEAAYTEHNRDLLYIRVDPALDSIRSYPRYADLIRRMNFPK